MKRFAHTTTEILRHVLAGTLAALLAFGPAPRAFADVKSNDPRVVQNVNNSQIWDITFKNGAIIRYSSFDVGKTQTANFISTDGANARVLNRISSAKPTMIDGKITGSGRIYIVNPAGVFFGSTAQVNVTQLQAAAGNLSDRDFKAGRDHYSNLSGTVSNAAQASAENPDAGIFANAVALVGKNVQNSGDIETNSWIIMAAGRDVFIGQNPDGTNGLLLRVEGGADAVFDKKAVGVSNTGTLSAVSPPTPPGETAPPAARISLGAGDLYGTAIFNTGAIQAREVALQASNKGDVALGGTVQAGTLDVTFGGDQNGKLVAPGGAGAQTLNVGELDLHATGAKGQVVVANPFELRSEDGTGHTGTVNVDQQAKLTVSNLKNLRLGSDADRAGTELGLTSKIGIIVDEKSLVTGTRLTLDAPAVRIDGANDPLVVDRLNLKARLTESQSDLVANGTDELLPDDGDANTPPEYQSALTIGGNLQMDTKPGAAGGATLGGKISALNGTVSSVGDIITSDGGGLRIEGADVKLGKLSLDGTKVVGGTILNSGNTVSAVTIVADNTGKNTATDDHLKGSVQANSILTMAALQAAGVDQTVGGDVTVTAKQGDLHLFGDVLTTGGAGKNTGDPQQAGGSVHLSAAQTLTVNNITTGGADTPVGQSREHADILLAGSEIVLNGNLSARAPALDNNLGQRNRTVDVEGPLTLGADQVAIAGGPVTVTGHVKEGQKHSDPNDPNSALVDREVALQIDAGPLRLDGGADLSTLRITSRGPNASVLFGGDVTADKFVDITFATDGVGNWGTSGANPVSVHAPAILVGNDPNGTSGGVTLGDNLKLDLTKPAVDPNDPNATPARPSFQFSQDRAIDPTTIAMLFGNDRFTGGIQDKSFSLITKAGMTLSQDSATAMTNGNLDLVADSFTALPAAGAPRLSFNVQSFKLTTLGKLDANLDVTATGTDDDQVIGLQSGAGTAGPGDLSVKGHYAGHAILLAAGDGVTEGGRTDGVVTIDSSTDTSFSNIAKDSHPEVFGIAQDANLVSNSVPAASQFAGGSVAGMELRLESDDGTVSLDSTHAGLYTNTKLVIDGANGISFGSSPLVLDGLTARSRTGLTLSQDVTVTPEDPTADGAITLLAGNGTGVGDLNVDAKLSADVIDLTAGLGDGTATVSRVNLGDHAIFAGDASQPNPKHFFITQDAALAAADLPTRSNFADPSAMAGMELGLRSLGGDLTVAGVDLIQNTALTLEGKTKVDLQVGGADLELGSLAAKGPMTFDGSMHTAGDLAIDGALTLDKAIDQSHPSGDQQLTADGALTITGATTKSTAGSIGIGSTDPAAGIGGAVAIGAVTTNHTGGRIVIQGNTSVTTGKLDASGTPPLPTVAEPHPLAVSVTGKGAVDVAGIDASGKAGAANQNGINGGNVLVSGGSVVVGTVNTSGGAGGSTSARQNTTVGGDAGSIVLTATGGNREVGIRGDLLAAGGVGNRSDTSIPLAPLIGKSADVTVNGSLLLASDSAVTGRTSTIRGQNVLIDGNVAQGTELDDANAPVPIDPQSTGLTVAAKGTLRVTGSSIRAGLLDLEAQQGNLDMSGKEIDADNIRLAATDGAGGNTESSVDIDGTMFHGSDWDVASQTGRRIISLTLEQDKGFGGPDGSVIPNVNAFQGTGDGVEGEFARALGLISQDHRVILGAGDLASVKGTRLTLASNAVTPAGVDPVEIDVPGQTLELERLQLGSVLGAIGANGSNAVGGNTTVNGDLALTAQGADEEALRAYGNLVVNGDANVKGRGTFSGDGAQTFHVAGDLDFGGSTLGKTTNGSFTVEAQHINLTGDSAQTISNDSGQLIVGGPLVKGDFIDKDGDGIPDPNTPPLLDPNDPNSPPEIGQRSLSLIGVSEDPNAPAVQVKGTTDVPGGGRFAIAIANGDLLISATNRAAGSTTTSTGSYELDGDVLAYGDVVLDGEGTFKSNQDTITVAARHNPYEIGSSLSGELQMGGVKSATGNLRLVADGDNPTGDVEHPSAIHLSGNFAGLAGGLEVDGTVDFTKDTTISAAGDVTFDAEVQGDKSLTVQSGGTINLADDVSMTAGALSLSGNGGVHFTSTNDTQFIRADSLTFGSKATPTKSGAATLVRDGNLSLAASKGSVSMASGQRMVVNGSLDVSAPQTIVLDDTAALRISLVSHDLTVRSGATIMGNSIVASASPVVTSNGLATFATPTRTELSDKIANQNILIRQIHPDGSPLSLDAAFASGGDIFFPPVDGPAQFDYAAQTPRPPLRYPITRPEVDVFELDAALLNRPLWADELLAYLEERSLETPGVSQAVEHLPPVEARPGDPLGPTDHRVRSAAAEQAVTLYREVFRPDVARNPETGYLDGPGKAAAIRAAFQAPVDALRHGKPGAPISGTELRSLIDGDPAFAEAQSYRSQLDQLLAAGDLALSPDQKSRFRALLLSEVTPYGIGAAEFASAIQ